MSKPRSVTDLHPDEQARQTQAALKARDADKASVKGPESAASTIAHALPGAVANVVDAVTVTPSEVKGALGLGKKARQPIKDRIAQVARSYYADET